MKDKKAPRWGIIAPATVVALIGAYAVYAGQASPLPHPRFDGPVIEQRQGTMGGEGDVGLGLGGVWPDGVSFQASDGNGNIDSFHLDVGGVHDAFGLHVRLCAVWVDTSVGPTSPPGSDASQAYYVVGSGYAPDCPARWDV